MDVHMAAEKEVSLEALVTRTVESGDSYHRMLSTRSLSIETAKLRLTSPLRRTAYVGTPATRFFYPAQAQTMPCRKPDVMPVTRGVGRDYPFGDAFPARVWNKAFKYTYT